MFTSIEFLNNSKSFATLDFAFILRAETEEGPLLSSMENASNFSLFSWTTERVQPFHCMWTVHFSIALEYFLMEQNTHFGGERNLKPLDTLNMN